MIYNIGIQLAGFAFLMTLLAYFFTRKRLPTRAMRCFKLLCLSSVLMLVFDISTALIVSTQDTELMYSSLSLILHRFYYFSTGAVAYSLFRYIYARAKRNDKFCLVEMLVLSAPFIIMSVLEFVLEIKFVDGGAVSYSTGLAVYALYVNLACQFALAIIFAIWHRKTVGNSVFIALGAAIGIYLAFAVVQMIFPTLLIASLANVLTVLLLFVTLENPDSLLDRHTDIFNRDGFINQLESIFLGKKPHTVVAIGFEGYSRVCSAMGMNTGEALMQGICKSIYDDYKSLSRIDSTTIGFILSGTAENNLPRIKALFENFQKPFDVNGIIYRLSPYACAFSCPSEAGSVDEVIDNINYSLIEAKVNGTGSLVTFNDELIGKRKRYNRIVEILDTAVYANRFEVFYQPIYNVQSQTFDTAEALVRLKDDSLGYISPEEFIPIAEKTGHILKLGMIVFDEVCKIVSEMNIRAMGLKKMHINLSGVQCMQANLAEQLVAVMEAYHIPPDIISLEITETSAMQSDDLLVDSMGKMISFGSTFSLDDYGSGYSSMGYIIKFPFSQIKFDKSIIWSYFESENEKGKTVMDSNISMIKKLDMSVVAEGVETEEQARELAKIGVDYLQGFYFAYPQPRENFIDFLRVKNCS